ncbi:MAG: DUF2235 domain-containing protein [Rhodobacteraceae bacterium]|nr:DUF2235 domain-containing protein [Paracoccaceae bacterium]
MGGSGGTEQSNGIHDRLLDGGAGPGARTLVVILDGTLGSLDPGRSTNAGRIFRLLLDLPPVLRPSVFYEEGIQWTNWRDVRDVITGRGINPQIRRAYGFLASHYRPGDRVFFFGYSRGAFAVRSLAGLIDRIGLIKPRFAREPMIQQVWKRYRTDPHGEHAKVFARKFCQTDLTIQMVGVFDTVKALGWRLPGLRAMSEKEHAFHSHHLGNRVRRGFHALALNETRVAFEPVMWESRPDWHGHVEQVWFRGNHSDVGGQLTGFNKARPLSNIPLVWMLENAEACGLPLPDGWRDRFPQDATAPSCGGWRGWGMLFAHRRRRRVGRDPSERLHPSALARAPASAAALPLVEWDPGDDFTPPGTAAPG